MDLADFLTARLAEDKAAALAATEGPWAWAATGEKDNSWAVALVGDADEEEKMLSGHVEAGDGIIIDPVCEAINGNLADGAHIARHDPARVLREVEAKRAILARCQMVLAAFHDPEGVEWPDVNRRERHHARRTIEDMASAYRDHEDYDPAWEA